MVAKNQTCKPWQLELFRTLAKNNPVDPKEIHTTVCVLSTPRCGSTLFCDVLNNTGLLGWIEEWFNAEYFCAWRQATGIDFTLEAYLKWVIAHSSRNGVWGVKWHIAQVHWMQKKFKFDRESIKFDHCFYLRREDKIAQAVSMAKALKSNQFRSYEACQNNELPQLHEIANALYVITDHEECYETKYKQSGDVELWYEQYANGNEEFFDGVLERLGIDAPDAYHANVKKQRNKETETLTRHFKEFLRGER
jgi:LPS sulfotransferase NodH